MISMKSISRGMVLLLAIAGTACDQFEPVFVDALRLNPDSAHISPGQSASFTATALSERGLELPDRAGRVRWTLPNGNIATADTAAGTITITALQLGTATFTGRLGRGSVQGRAYVQPPGLARIEIRHNGAPITSLVGSPGSRPRLTAHLFDAAGTEMSPAGFRLSWATGDNSFVFVGQVAGPISDMLLRRTGATQVRLIVGGMSTSISVTIT